MFTNPGTLTDPYANLPGGVSPFPYSYSPSSIRFILPAAIGGPSLDFRIPYVYQMNLTVQRQSIDSADSQDDTSGSVQNFNNIAADRGRTDFDRRHNFVMSGIWRINYFKNGNPIARHVLNGWSLSAIVSLRSGLPLTITNGSDANLDGNNNDRANLIGDPLLDPNRPRNEVVARWFNTAAFAPPAAGQDGTAGRNIIDGPGSKNVDLGIFRDFNFTERFRLQFRAEATNALNIVNLRDPQTGRNNSLFGQVREARPMREVQLGLRLTF